MADNAVHIADNSPHEVAYKLMRDVALAEKKTLHSNPGQGHTVADRKWILDTYAECLVAVHSPNSRL
jgi:hypothetical protein